MSAIVLFDGVCNFCNASVNFIIEHDRDGYFKFAPLQSDAGMKFAGEYGIVSATVERAEDLGVIPIDSLILIEDGRAYTHSTGALRIARRLSAPWSWLYGFMIVPQPIRDLFYRLFAKYRYRFFGKKDECMIPTPEVQARFLT
jgi:predicted DCC family thiol-disulfide oxidoreductase YuxK